MPIAVLCPNCDSKLNAPDSAAGKTVRCPKCKEPMVLPDAEDEPKKKPDEDEKPIAKRKRVVVEDDDEDEEDERPRKKKKGKKKPTKSGVSPVLIGAIAAGVLFLGGGAFAAYWFGFREKPKETASNNSNTPPVSGVTPGPPPGGGNAGGGTGKPLFETNNPQTAAYSKQSLGNMKQMGIAFLNFTDTYNGLPTGIADSTGKAGLSWRVAILPFIEQGALYQQFKLNEPWDSEHNKKLIPSMPRIFAAPGQDPSSGKTYYRSFSGPDTAFHSTRAANPGQPLLGRKLSEFQDGTSNTALVAEAADPVEWTKPDEIVYSAKGPVPKLGGIFAGGCHLLFADSSVRRMRANASEKSIRAMITPGGGEVYDLDE